MPIKSAKFVTSSAKITQLPEASLPEYAFIGRSNVGKSSLINALTNNTKLAKVSSTPGKTQLINHFLIDDSWFLVDLPGYGYAKVSKKIRDTFGLMIKSYIDQRSTLMCTFVLVDSRIPPQKIDLEFMEWLGSQGIPFVIVSPKPISLKEVCPWKSISKTIRRKCWKHGTRCLSTL